MPLRPDGPQVARLREAAGLSQADLAAKAELSMGTIERLEAGKGCYASTLKLVADALNVEADALRVAASSEVGRSRRAGTAWCLPGTSTRFIGRAQELEALEAMLDSERVVTLKGTGGAGKSRLSLELARRVSSRFPVAFIELAALVPEDSLPTRIAEALNAPSGPRDPHDRIVAALGERDCLLVLDNCEHLAPACALLVGRLLCRCPDLRIVATSRGRLKVEGERVHAVEPLAAPDEAVERTVAAISESEAVQLLVDRVSRARPDFELTDEHADALVAICRRLEGLPLAIELAAAQAEQLSIARVAEHLTRSAVLLDWGTGSGEDRHRTLQSAIAWSHDRLEETTRVLYRRLAVFADMWTLELAQQACASSPLSERDVAVGLLELLDRSLIETSHRDGEARCRFLTPIRDHALLALRDTDEHESLASRHLELVLARVEELVDAFFGPEVLAAGAELERLVPDVDVALARAREGEAALVDALRLAARLNPWLSIRGREAESLHQLESLIALADETTPQGTLARARGAFGVSLFATGRHREGLEECRQAHRLAVEVGAAAEDRLQLEQYLAITLMGAGHLHDAIEAFESCIEQARGTAERVRRVCLVNLAFIYQQAGRSEDSREAGREAIASAHEAGDLACEAVGHLMVAEALSRMDDLIGAKEAHERAQRLARSCGALRTEAPALRGLALTLVLLGRPEEARGWAERVLALAERHHLEPFLRAGHYMLGLVELMSGRAGAAESHLRRSFELAWRAARPGRSTGALRALAWLSLEQGEARRASELWGIADALEDRHERASTALPGDMDWEHLAGLPRRLHERLGLDGHESARRRGWAMPEDEIPHFVLGGREPPSRRAVS
ncbi:MAG: helix-turn-helix domain-containing protein [Acidobacteriota bacterium]